MEVLGGHQRLWPSPNQQTLRPRETEHWKDKNGNPTGGISDAIGITISWQNGPLGSGVTKTIPNGAFVETLVEIVIDRLEFYQNSKFKCIENANAILHLQKVLSEFRSRTDRRKGQGTEGTYNGN